jgi:hypothetical protein
MQVNIKSMLYKLSSSFSEDHFKRLQIILFLDSTKNWNLYKGKLPKSIEINSGSFVTLNYTDIKNIFHCFNASKISINDILSKPSTFKEVETLSKVAKKVCIDNLSPYEF